MEGFQRSRARACARTNGQTKRRTVSSIGLSAVIPDSHDQMCSAFVLRFAFGTKKLNHIKEVLDSSEAWERDKGGSYRKGKGIRI